MDNIGFEDTPKKEIDHNLTDEKTESLKKASIEKLEKKQMDNKVKAEAGIIEIPKESEQIPKELPKYLFSLGAKAISCPKFNLDEQEAQLLAKHVSILTGNINSKIFSLLIIVIVILSKVTECFEAINKKFGKKKSADKPKDTQAIYDESMKSEVSG